MARLWNRDYTREQLLSYCGSIDQAAGIRRYVYSDGKAAGVEADEFRTGSGFRFVDLLGRGLDLGAAECMGMPLCFRSPVGVVHPRYYDLSPLGFLRSLGRGLMFTCGLSSAGMPSTEPETLEKLGLT